MGWDVTSVVEYYDSTNRCWKPLDRYSVVYDPCGVLSIAIIEPVLEERNYNIFRPIANIRNTKRIIDYERQQIEQSCRYYAFDQQTCTQLHDLYYPETDEPTAVVDSETTMPDDLSPVTKQLIEPLTDGGGVLHVYNGKTLEKFSRAHYQYHNLARVIGKINSKIEYYNRYSQDDKPLNNSDVRLICVFQC